MKKLKLSKSKHCDTKQQKISNFFATSKSVPSQSSVTNKETELKATVNGEVIINQPSRSPGKILCVTCSERSPNRDSAFCNNCNLSTSRSLLHTGETIVKTKEIKISDNSISEIKNSPDLIPPTPVIDLTVGKRVTKCESKSVKRKFNFGDPDSKKKKLFNEQLTNISDVSGVKYDVNQSRSKNNKQDFKGKENVTGLGFTNPHSKLLLCLSDEKCTDFSSPNNSSSFKTSENKVKESIIDSDCLEKEVENNKIVNVSDISGGNNYTDRVSNSCQINCNAVSNQTDVKKELDSVQNCTSTTSIKQSAFEDIKKPKEVQVCTPHCDVRDCDSTKQCLSEDNTETDDFNASLLEDLSFNECLFEESIRLDKGLRCKVISIEDLKSCGEVILGLKPDDSQDTATCVLRDSWVNTCVNVGDTVSVTAKPVPGQDGCWVVDNNFGLLIAHSDMLVSGTTIVGSLFCMRRSVISDMYRGVDSDSSIMVIGSILHQLLQEVLKRKVSTMDEIQKVLSDFIKTRQFIFNLYSSGMSLEKTKEKLCEFIPKIHEFINKYISSNRKKCITNSWNDKESWGGTIMDVADIEENIWCPRLGVKGKVDVTVKTLVQNNEMVMPLELKTGRASFSSEHRGQVILYTMMMSELGQTVDSGLLLYLREGVMKEIKTNTADRRDLMMLRNQLVTQLKASHQTVMASDNQIAPPVLPQPINHHSACEKCPYLTICSAALSVNKSSELPDSNPLKKLSVSSTDHLELNHIMYVFHWTGLLRLEHTETHLNSTALHNIWTLPPTLRMKKGTCIANAQLIGAVTEVTVGSYEHVFQWSISDGCGLTEGDYVIVSTVSRPAIAAGPIRHIASNSLTIHLERDLRNRQNNENIWHLDKYESQTGLVFNMTNLGCLLDNTEQINRLRKAVINLELPVFKEKLSSRVLKASVDLLAPLNEQQRKAIFRSLAAEHYILIKGMPGTGKTATIVALIELAVRLGHSVLITSHTHSAVDNVLLRLRGRVDFLRLGATHKLHPELAEYGEKNCNFNSPEDISEYYNSKRVVAVTCLGSSHPLISRRQFDLCLIDEATQVLQPTVLRPLFSAKKFILIGDPNQLPPLVRSSQAKQLGLGQSLFARLDRAAVTSELNLQYRMNQCITEVANTLTYSGKLQCANPVVASATLTFPLPISLDENPEWVRSSLSGSLHQSVMVIDTGVTHAVGCTNRVEADIVIQLLTALNKVGMPDERVGVIAPYRAQVEFLRKQTKTLQSCVEVNTVDQYQGRDKDIILYSCTRSIKPTESDILGDKNRLTVAITRARHKLIIIGNKLLLEEYPLFSTIFQTLPNDCTIRIS